MNHGEIVGFLWGVADLIRDTFKRGKYQDVILPLTVLRRLAPGDWQVLAGGPNPAAASFTGGGEWSRPGQSGYHENRKVDFPFSWYCREA